MLLDDHLLRYINISDWKDFRHEALWNIEINNIMTTNIKAIQKLFREFCVKGRRYIDKTGAIKMTVIKSKFLQTDKDCIWCFGMAKMVCLQESCNSAKNFYNRLFYDEFLEFLGRLAYIKGNKSTQKMIPNLNKVLDCLLPLVGCSRSEVVIEAEDISESDADY